MNKKCCVCGAEVEIRFPACPECGCDRFESVRVAPAAGGSKSGKTPAGPAPRRTDKAAPAAGTAMKCDICGKPIPAVGYNHCNTCGRNVCRACYVARERLCRYCFGTTLDLNEGADANATAKPQPELQLPKKQGCLGVVLLIVGVLALALFGLLTAQPAINALAPNAGDFLDFPLDSMRRAANSAYQAARYEEAARFYLAALEHDITSASDIYNLACCYGLLKKDTLAATCLTRAVRAGFDDIGHAREDPDFDSVRASSVFVAAVESSVAAAKSSAAAKGTPLAVSAETFQTCYVRLPEGFDSTKTYPLLVGLHGYGGNPESFARLYERAGKPQLIYAVLQAPYAMSAGSEPGYSWVTESESDSTVRRRSSVMSSDFVAEACRRLAAQYHVSGTWLLGFSQGCGLAHVTGIRHHDLFKGIIGFGGGFDTLRFSPAELEAAKGLPVFSSHGSEDRVAEPKYGADAREFLKRKGFKITFVGFKGGHAVPEAPLRDAMLWMGVRN